MIWLVLEGWCGNLGKYTNLTKKKKSTGAKKGKKNLGKEKCATAL